MIKDLKDLSEFLKICRKQGVTDILYEGLTVKFGEISKKSRREGEMEDAEIPTDELTPEQLMYYSVGGAP